jgi:PAS domain-containing protein
MIRQVRVGTWSWDLPSGLLDFDPVTEELVRLAGLDPDRWDRHIQTWMDRIHPDDRPAVQRAIEQSFIDGGPYAVEYRVIAEDGTVSLLELRAAFEFDPTGTPVRMTGTAWNMSARRSQEGWLVALLEMHPDSLYVMSLDGRVEWANIAGRALAGLKVVGATLPPDLYAAVKRLLDRARCAPETPETEEVSLEHAAGEAGLYHVRAVQTGGFITMSVAGAVGG